MIAPTAIKVSGHGQKHRAIDYAASAKPLGDKKASRAKRTIKVPLDETAVQFDDDRIDEELSDARDEAHLDARRATQGKYL